MKPIRLFLLSALLLANSLRADTVSTPIPKLPEYVSLLEIDATKISGQASFRWKATARGWIKSFVTDYQEPIEGSKGAYRLSGTGDVMPPTTDRDRSELAAPEDSSELTVSAEGFSDPDHDFWQQEGDRCLRTFELEPVSHLINPLQSRIGTGMAAKLEPSHATGSIRIKLPAGFPDADTLTQSVSRDSFHLTVSRWVRDGVAGIDWSFRCAGQEITSEETMSHWRSGIDSASALCRVELEFDTRSFAQRRNLGGAFFLLLALLAAGALHRFVSTRNVERKEGVYYAPVAPAMPGWTRLYPWTLAASALFLLHDLIPALRIFLGGEWSLDGHNLRGLVGLHVCASRIFLLGSLVSLVLLFRARRNVFPRHNAFLMILAALSVQIDTIAGYPGIRHDGESLMRIAVNVLFMGAWYFWMLRFTRHRLAPSWFREEHVNPSQPEAID